MPFVSPAERAEQHVYPHPDTLAEGQRLMEGLRGKPGGLPARQKHLVKAVQQPVLQFAKQNQVKSFLSSSNWSRDLIKPYN